MLEHVWPTTWSCATGAHPHTQWRSCTRGCGTSQSRTCTTCNPQVTYKVTIWDAANLPSSDITLLLTYVNQWNAANAASNQAGMNAAHASAEAIRNKYRRIDEIGTSDGDTIIYLDPNKTYKPWDRFSSPDNAAIAFSWTYIDGALNINREMGAIIYAVAWHGSTPFSYTFGSSWVGAEYNVLLGIIQNVLSQEKHPLGSQITWVALAHTHPVSNSGAVRFSIQDMQLANGETWFTPPPPFNIPILNPLSSMYVYVTSRNPVNIEVRKYTPNSGQNNMGTLIWS